MGSKGCKVGVLGNIEPRGFLFLLLLLLTLCSGLAICNDILNCAGEVAGEFSKVRILVDHGFNENLRNLTLLLGNLVQQLVDIALNTVLLEQA